MVSDPEPNQPPDPTTEPPSPPKKDWLRMAARATETVAPLVARQAPKPDDLPTDTRGRWATALAITGILVAVLQFLVQFYDLVTRPLAPLARALPYLAAGLLLAGAALGIYALLRAHTRRQRLVSAGATLVALAVAGSWGGWLAYDALRPPEGYRILISEFDGSAAGEHIDFGRRIAENLRSQLLDAGQPIEIKRTTEIYSDPDAARRAGANQKAGMVIWGWYDTRGVSPHVEVLNLPGSAAPATTAIPLFFATANAASPSAAPAALQPALSKLAPVTRTPLTLPSIDLFTEYGADQMTYVTSAVLATSYLANGDLQQAVALYDQALASVAGDPAEAQGQEVVYYQRATANYRLGRYAAARADLEQALKLQPGYAPAHLLLGAVLADHCTPGRDLDAALAAASQAASLDPADPAAQRLLGDLLLRSGDAATALEHAEAARDLDAAALETHSLLAAVYDALGRTAESRAARTTALALAQQAAQQQASAPPGVDALYQLGDAYVALDRYDEALAAYAQAQNVAPQDLRIHRARGNIHYWQGDYAAAATEYAAWAQQAPQDPSPHVLLGLMYDQQGLAQEAVAAYERAAQVDACDVTPYLLLGGSQVAAGDYAAAGQSYSRALAIDPQNPDVLYAAGANSLLREDYAAAAEQFATLTQRQPQLMAAHYYLGTAYEALGESAQAQAAYTTAATLGEAQSGPPAVYLAYTYEKLGRTDDAIAIYVQLLEEQETPELHAYLGALYAAKGALSLARQEYARALELDPQQTMALLVLASMDYAQGDLPAAIGRYEAYLAQEDSAEVHNYAAQAYWQLGDLPAALRHLQAALRLDARNVALAQRLATIANWLNDLDAAQQALDGALRLQPTEPALHFLAGQVAYKRCDLPRAIAALQHSVELTPTNTLYLGSLGGYLLAQGDVEAMQPYLAQLRSAPPADYAAHWLAAALLLEGAQVSAAGAPTATTAAATADIATEQARAEYSLALAAPDLPAGAAAAMHTALGSLAYWEKDMAAARREFSATLALAPDYVDAEIGLGDLALLAGDPTAAEQHYRRAQENLPAYAANYSYDSAAVYGPLLPMRLALVARQRGDVAGEQAARQAAETALAALQATAPDWASVSAAAGTLALLRGDAESAASAFARSVACDRTLVEAQEQIEKLVAAGSTGE